MINSEVYFIKNIYLQSKLTFTHRRQVYKWFLGLHKLCTFLGIVGYILVMLTIMGIPVIFRLQPVSVFDWAIMLLFYGLYYGVLGRDLAEVCAGRMAAHIGVRCLDSSFIFAYHIFNFIFKL